MQEQETWNTLVFWARQAVSKLCIWTRLTLQMLTSMFKDPVRTAQLTHTVSVIKTSQLMLYREIMAVCSEIHTKHINTV